VQAYGREDGMMDLEAELVDIKGYDFPHRDGSVFKAGTPIHHMHLRITVDDAYSIVDAQAVYDAAPYGEACASIDAAYAAGLVGMNLLKNFRGQVRERFGRTAGCTHMTELSQVLPTAAVQANAGRRREEAVRSPEHRPFQLDGCHALSTDGPVVLEYYPRWYTGRPEGAADESGADAPAGHSAPSPVASS
jgi:hypothetical protein